MIAVRHPLMILLVSLCLVALAGAGLQYLVVESDYEIFFDEVSPRLAAHYEVEEQFGRNDYLQIAVIPREGDVFTVEVMAAIEAMTRRFWEIPYSRRVDSITNYPYTYVEGDDLSTVPMFEEAGSLTPEQWQQRKQFALTNVATKRWLVSDDGRVTGVTATIMLPENNHLAPIQLAKEFEDLVAELQATYPELDIRPYGSILLNKAFFTHATEEFGRLLAIGIVLLLIVSALILRSVMAAFCIGILMGTAVIAGMGIASWLGIPLTAPSSSAPVIVMALSVASTIHLIAGVLKRLHRGVSKTDAVRSALAENFRPILLTSLTTALGFLCLNISDVPPYRMLGNTAAIGVMAAFLLTFTLLPALLVLLPFRSTQQSGSNTQRGHFWRGLAEKVSTNPRQVVLVSGAVMLLLSLPMVNNVIDDRLLTYFDEDVPIRKNTEYVMENFSSFYGAFLPVPAGEENGITSPEYLKVLDQYLEWARQQPEVKNATGFSDVIKQLNQNMNGDDPDHYRIPDNRDLIAQYLLLYEMSLPFGKDLGTQINSSRDSSLVRIGFYDVSSGQMRAFEARSDHYIAEHFPKAMQSHLAGPPILFAHIWNDATRSNLLGMILAVVLICSLIGLALKSVRLGLVSLVPNIVPAFMAFGIWGLVKGQIDIGSSIVAVIAFGIIVDDTIHFMHRYHYFRHKGQNYQQAVESSFQAVGKALWTTTVVLTLGFGILAFSDFTLNSSMGLLTGITIVLALFVDFIFLPAFLGVVDRNEKRPL